MHSLVVSCAHRFEYERVPLQLLRFSAEGSVRANVLEASVLLNEEAIVAQICAADSSDSDGPDDVVVQPTQVVSSQEAHRMIPSHRAFISAKDPPLS